MKVAAWGLGLQGCDRVRTLLLAQGMAGWVGAGGVLRGVGVGLQGCKE